MNRADKVDFRTVNIDLSHTSHILKKISNQHYFLEMLFTLNGVSSQGFVEIKKEERFDFDGSEGLE